MANQPGSPDRAERDEIMKTFALVSQLGWRMVGSILAGLFVGLALDGHFSVRGWFLIPFLIAGIGVGFWSCYRILMRLCRDECPPKNG